MKVLVTGATGSLGRAVLPGCVPTGSPCGTTGVGHLVYVSIVGVDRVSFPYYRHKLAAERVIAEGPVPWSVLRATQFHPFLDRLITMAGRPARARARGPGAARPAGRPRRGGCPALRAARRRPARRHEEHGGPQVLRFDEAAYAWRAARRSRRPLLPVRLPGRLGRVLRAGGLTADATPTGTRTGADHLAATYGGTDRR